VFGELAHSDWPHRLLVLFGSLVMIAGAVAVSTAVATEREHTSTNSALLRECSRYGLDYSRVLAALSGSSHTNPNDSRDRRGWWDYAILTVAAGTFVYLGLNARVPALTMDFAWVWILAAVLGATVLVAGGRLWKTTRFS
jgi:hypothetical protein